MSREPYVARPYQRIMSQFLLDTPRAQLIAEMGMGKTSGVLATIDMLKLAGSNFFPALVIAPKRVAAVVWPGELTKWGAFEDLSITKVLGDQGKRLNALKAKRTDLYVVNYDNVQWLTAQFGKSWPFKIVVADESTRLKGFRLRKGGVRAAALAQVAKLTGRWMNLTGFIAPNGLTDLWGQYWYLDFGRRLGLTYTAFLERFFFMNEYTHQVTLQPGAAAEIHAAIADITLALRTEDWLDVHKLNEVRVPTKLPAAALKQYEKMEAEYFVEIGPDGQIEAATAAARSAKLLQLASGSIYDASGKEHKVHDAKVEALQDIIDETGGEPLLVAYWWQFDAPRILKAFPHARVLESEQDIVDWNAGKIQMMLVHPASAGHGISLQHGGRNIALYTQIWDAELRAQVIERLGPARQAQSGYDRVVNVFSITAEGTIDGEVLERNVEKLTIEQALQRARARRS